MLFLLSVAITPGFILLAWLLYMDRRESEPLSLVLLVILCGAVSTVAAYYLEIAIPIYKSIEIWGMIQYAFVKIAPVEEIIKLGAVLPVIWNHPRFNEENDGIVYAGAGALGFAMAENILFVLNGGLSLAMRRAVTAFPLHTLTGIMVGYFIGVARFAPPRRALATILEGLLLAILIHGTYDMVVIGIENPLWIAIPVNIGLFAVGLVYFHKGRQLLSQRRAIQDQPVQALPTDAGVNQAAKATEAKPPARPAPRWQMLISRALFVWSVGVWAFVVGMFSAGNPMSGCRSDDVCNGAVALTLPPLLVGIILEISYRRRKNSPSWREREENPGRGTN